MAFKERIVVRSSGRISPKLRRLEDEISHLRTAMERIYTQEATFNSDVVIEISRKLDIKINEYMRERQLCART